MADPDNLPDALIIIKDIDDDRGLLSDLLNEALANADPGQFRRNRITHAHGQVRRMGRNMHRQLTWMVNNLTPSIPAGRLANIQDLLQNWDDSPFTKFDDDAPIPILPP